MTTLQTLFKQAIEAINQRNYVEAHQHLVTVIRQYGEQSRAYFLLGIVHIELAQINKAITLLHKALGLETNPRINVYLTKCYALQGNMNEALHYAAQAPVSELNAPLDLDTMGVALSRVGLHDQALAYFARALELDSRQPQFYYNYGVSAKFAGQFARARQAFTQAIELNPDFYQAHFALTDLGRPVTKTNNISRLLQVKARLQTKGHPPDPDAALHIGHALSKEYEAQGEFNKAFTALAQAKQVKKDQLADTHTTFDALFTHLRQMPPEVLQTTSSHASQPLFVMGMPRSGTTLVERILSHHSKVVSGGELQDFGVAVKQLTATPSAQVLDLATLEQASQIDPDVLGAQYLARTQFLMQPGAYHLVDKLPFNFFYLPHILRALPQAKIVCLLRDPLDTCIGNYRQLFSIHSPYYAYAYDLLAIGRVYQQFYDLVHHWQRLAPSSIRLQSYEKLVTQPMEESRTLLDFCGLAWEPQCVQVERNLAPVSTASKVQVREAINTRSIGRWKHYAAHLNELKVQLGIAR